jgi:hypothetical protein
MFLPDFSFAFAISSIIFLLICCYFPACFSLMSRKPLHARLL